MPQLIDKIIQLEQEIKKQHPLRSKIKLKLAASLIAGLLVIASTTTGVIAYKNQEKKQVIFENGKLNTYGGLLQQIKKYVNENKFEEASIAAKDLNSMLKKDNYSYKHLKGKYNAILANSSEYNKTIEQKINLMEKQLKTASDEFAAIKTMVANKKYDDVPIRIKDLAAKLEKINYSKAKTLLNHVENYTFVKAEKVDAELISKRGSVEVWRPKHYVGIEVNPYSGTEKAVEDNILIK